jgi:hypothetical protein
MVLNSCCGYHQDGDIICPNIEREEGKVSAVTTGIVPV